MSDRNYPVAWKATTVGEVVERLYSGPSPTCEERQIASQEEWGLLKTTAITWDGWNPRAHKVAPRIYWANHSIEVRDDDVLITKAGPRNRVGVVVHIPKTPRQLMVSGKMIGIVPDKRQVVPQLLAYVLAGEAAQKFIDERTTGMAEAQVNFTNQTLASTPIILPPLAEQRKIAEILDTVDDSIHSTERSIEKLESVKVGIIDKLLTPHDNWSSKRLSDLVDPDAPICYGIVQAGPHLEDGAPVLTIGNIRRKDFRQAVHRTHPSVDQSYRRSRVQPGDLLLSIKATIGKVAVVPEIYSGNISRDLARIRLTQGYLPDYMRILLESNTGQRILDAAVVGTTRAEISIGILKNLMFSVPSLREQWEIVQISSELEGRTAIEMSKLAKLRRVKQGLMDDLLTGRVRVAVD